MNIVTWSSLGTFMRALLFPGMGPKPDWSGVRLGKWRQSITTLWRSVLWRRGRGYSWRYVRVSGKFFVFVFSSVVLFLRRKRTAKWKTISRSQDVRRSVKINTLSFLRKWEMGREFLGQDRHFSNSREAGRGVGGSRRGWDHALPFDGFTFLHQQRPGVCEGLQAGWGERRRLGSVFAGNGRREPGRKESRWRSSWCLLRSCVAPPMVAGAGNAGGVHLG